MERVIFDTNAYRYFASGKTIAQIDKLLVRVKEREEANKISPLMSPIVAKELLAHIASKNDPAFDICINAIHAMYYHCGDVQHYHMIASPELLISNAFFGMTIPAKIETNNAIGQMLFHFASNPTNDHTFRKFQYNLNANAKHVFESETEFAESIRQLIVAIDPTAQGWRIFEHDEGKRTKALQSIRGRETSVQIALGYIYVTVQLLILSGQITTLIPNTQLMDMAGAFVDEFPEPIALYKFVLENCVNSEFNLTEDNRANFVWDINLMFNIGNHSIGGDMLHFVTDDKAMIRTAIASNGKYSIHTFDEYMVYLKC